MGQIFIKHIMVVNVSSSRLWLLTAVFVPNGRESCGMGIFLGCCLHWGNRSDGYESPS